LLAWCRERSGWQAGFLCWRGMPLVTTLPMALLWLQLPGNRGPKALSRKKLAQPRWAGDRFTFVEARQIPDLLDVQPITDPVRIAYSFAMVTG